MVMEHLVSFLCAPLSLLKTSFGHCLGNADDSAKRNKSKEDCFSKLPDEMLSSIISFLTLRDAVKMSLLSRRWRHIYASMSSLDFDLFAMFGSPGDCDSQRQCSHLCLRYRNTFVQRVNQFLQLHSGPKIMSFRFSFCFKREFTGDVDRWISFAVRMGVEKLNLNFACSDYFISCRGSDSDSDSMFGDNYSEMYNLSCQLLSEASKLNHLYLSYCTLQLESGVHFNSLISLELNQVPLSCGELQRILSRCLNLEWLGVRWCSVPGILRICAPSLKFLGVYCCSGLKEIELSAVNLTTFEFSEISETKFCFSNVPKLEKVFFRGHYCHTIDSIFSEHTRDLPEIKTLSISISSLWVQYIPKWPTSFSNVQQLELSIKSNFVEYDLLKITPILSACPLLQKFHIVMPSFAKYIEASMEEPPKCVHTQLKEVEFGGFSGTWNQIGFAILLLKNAVSLDQMIIDARYRLYLGGGKWKHGCVSTWSEDKRDFIHKQLQGKVFSESAKERLVMEHLVSFLRDRFSLLKTSFGHCLGNADDSAGDELVIEDYISKLPDEMLSSIISFLTLRDAVRMSLLSKRWRHFYASMSNLDFDLYTMFNTAGDCNSQRLILL